jgi:hypothetical protein
LPVSHAMCLGVCLQCLGPWLFSLLEVPPQLAGMTSQARHY